MAITKVYVENNEWLAPSAAASFRRVRAAGALGRLVDAGRTYWEQLALWLKGNGLAAKPNSTAAKHQLGLAIDVDTTFAAWLHKWGAAYGWIATLSYEWWHFEYFIGLDQHLVTIKPVAPISAILEDDDMPTFILFLFRRYLNREPVNREVIDYSKQAQNSGWSYATLEDAFKANKAERGTIVAAFKEYLGVAPTEAQIKDWTQGLTIKQVFDGIYNSPAAIARRG